MSGIEWGRKGGEMGNHELVIFFFIGFHCTMDDSQTVVVYHYYDSSSSNSRLPVFAFLCYFCKHTHTHTHFGIVACMNRLLVFENMIIVHAHIQICNNMVFTR